MQGGGGGEKDDNRHRHQHEDTMRQRETIMGDHMVNVIPQIILDMKSKLEPNKCCVYEADTDIMYVLRQEFFHLNNKP